jgi:hypothetical protein
MNIRVLWFGGGACDGLWYFVSAYKPQAYNIESTTYLMTGSLHPKLRAQDLDRRFGPLKSTNLPSENISNSDMGMAMGHELNVWEVNL